MKNKSLIAQKLPKRIWAVSIHDQENQTWLESDETESEVLFHWDDLNIESNTLTSISIGVAQQNGYLGQNEINRIAKGIYNSMRISKGDGILGVNKQNGVKKVGTVTAIKKDIAVGSKAIINWIKHFDEPIYIESLGDINNLSKVSSELVIEFLPEIDFKIDIIGFKNSDIMYSLPSEINYTGESLESISAPYPKLNTGREVTLFFGTTRERLPNGASSYYGVESDILKFGTCSVSIPKGHVQGELERPNKIFSFHFAEKIDKHVVITEVVERSEADFLRILSEGLSENDKKAALVFIHGYNVSFEEAAQRTGQIAWDIPFNGIAGFFSWPSAAKKSSYLKDIEVADNSVPSFEKFVELLIKDTSIEELHLIAHSMGNRILTFTLKNLRAKPELTSNLKVIKQIVLGAPDIDQDVFRNTLLPYFSDVGLRRTLYASDKDRAMKLSRLLRQGRPRIGDCGRSIFVQEELDTIDASNVPSEGNNHSYIFECKELLSDLYYLIEKGLTPPDRRLTAMPKDAFKYWLFPR